MIWQSLFPFSFVSNKMNKWVPPFVLLFALHSNDIGFIIRETMATTLHTLFTQFKGMNAVAPCLHVSLYSFLFLENPVNWALAAVRLFCGAFGPPFVFLIIVCLCWKEGATRCFYT